MQAASRSIGESARPIGEKLTKAPGVTRRATATAALIIIKECSAKSNASVITSMFAMSRCGNSPRR